MFADIISMVLQPVNTVMILVALLTFGALVTIALPFFERDKLRSRMKAIANERERLRQQNREQLAKKQAKLREASGGFMVQFVEMFGLRKLIDHNETRNRLDMAGLRRPSHLITFVFFRAIGPFIFGIAAFAYLYFTFPDQSGNERLLICLGVFILGFYFPDIVVKNLMVRRQALLTKAWPDALDLLLICVEAGISIENAFKRVGEEAAAVSIPLAEEMFLTTAELSYLQHRRQAYENLGNRTGLACVKAVVTSLIQAEGYGTPLGSALRVLAQESRDMRMAEAERKAAALPPKLTVPMMVFFMPAIFVVIIGPVIIIFMEFEL